MNKFSNNLSPEEDEALSLLAEECAEVIAIIQKIQRHGAESKNPDRIELGTNREQLETELGDLKAAIKILGRNFRLSERRMYTSYYDKIDKVEKWLHHAKVP